MPAPLPDERTGPGDTSRTRSLRVELIATLAVVLMMAVVSLSFLTEVLAAKRQLGSDQQRLRDHARALASVVAPLLGGGSPAAARRPGVEQALRASLGLDEIEAIEIYRRVESQSHPVITLGLAPPLPPPRPNLEPRGEVFTTETNLSIVDSPIRTFDDRSTVVLRLVARPSSFAGSDWYEIVIIAGGVGLVVLVLGVLLLELQVLRPLARIRGAVAQVGDGQLETRVPIEGPTELRGLAQALNRTAEALQTQIRQVEAQQARLVRADQLASVGRIAAGTAHEVGNPLAAILGYVELLVDPRAQPPLSNQQRDMLVRTRAQILRIQDIVGQLVDYSRPTRKSMQPIELVGAATQLLALVKHDPRCAEVELTVRGDPVDALADPAMLDQVLQNLVVNGARAASTTDSPARVEISIAPHAEHVRIDVRDSGPGVPPDVLPQLFQPFFTTTKAGEGTGLGLAICQGLVESMDGQLECVDKDPGPPDSQFPGALFRVSLRRAASRAQSANPPSNDGDASTV